MADAAGGSPPEGDAPNRRGWRLPDDAAAGAGGPGPPAYDAPRRDEDWQRAAPPPAQGRTPPLPSTLPQSVTGQARAVNTTSVQTPNGVQTTVVTFRLEQYDPRAGRTGVITVRLLGDEAIGFVADGDWVEVTGKTKRGFLKAAQAVNHTSQAQYSRPGQGCARVAMIVLFSFVVLFILAVFISIAVSIVSNR